MWNRGLAGLWSNVPTYGWYCSHRSIFPFLFVFHLLFKFQEYIWVSLFIIKLRFLKGEIDFFYEYSVPLFHFSIFHETLFSISPTKRREFSPQPRQTTNSSLFPRNLHPIMFAFPVFSTVYIFFRDQCAARDAKAWKSQDGRYFCFNCCDSEIVRDQPVEIGGPNKSHKLRWGCCWPAVWNGIITWKREREREGWGHIHGVLLAFLSAKHNGKPRDVALLIFARTTVYAKRDQNLLSTRLTSFLFARPLFSNGLYIPFLPAALNMQHAPHRKHTL